MGEDNTFQFLEHVEFLASTYKHRRQVTSGVAKSHLPMLGEKSHHLTEIPMVRRFYAHDAGSEKYLV